jgi:hypothetical protein
MQFGKPVLLVLLALGGCSTVTVRSPPAGLLADCPEPVAEITTNRELAEAYLGLRRALRLCNADKQALREWAELGS